MKIEICGTEAPSLIETIVADLPEIRSIHLFRTNPTPPIQDDHAMGEPEQFLISEGLKVREASGLPFWDALFLYLSQNNAEGGAIVARASSHNPQRRFSVSRESCSGDFLRGLIEQRPRETMLAISSLVVLESGNVAHLPMLDFHCRANAHNDRIVQAIITQLGISGYVLHSGRSYHFYGRTLLQESDLLSFLANALLYCPLIDRAWIAHQILERACGLRLSPGKDYHGSPIVAFSV